MLPKIQPAKLANCLAAFDDPEWLFEIKHDGFRSLAYLENAHCRLVSRRRNTYKSFEVLRSALECLRAQSAILDGEIVALAFALDAAKLDQCLDWKIKRTVRIWCARTAILKV